MTLFVNPVTRRLRSGWRALIFFSVLSLPNLLLSLLMNLFAGKTAAPASANAGNAPSFAVDWAMMAVYALMIAWVVAVSIACWRWLDGLSWRALGYQFHQGWSRDLWLGLLIGAAMIALVVALQMLGGGTRLHWRGDALGLTLREMLAATLLLLLAAAFEELLFRGYAFQTLLRDLPAWVPVIGLAAFFGLAHWTNPSRTNFSTLNTALAGLWLAAAVLRTRSLWLATGLHFSWNWTMGALFGLPVSGMRLPHSLFFATSETPLWLTGGSYGSEGGVTATLAFTLGALWLWRKATLRVASQTESALSDQSLNHSLT